MQLWTDEGHFRKIEKQIEKVYVDGKKEKPGLHETATDVLLLLFFLEER